MRTAAFLCSLLLLAAWPSTGSAEDLKIKTDMDFVKRLRKLMKCAGGKSPVCSVKFRGLDLEITDVNNPLGGAISVLNLGENQKYSPMGPKCILIEFFDGDLLIRGMAAKGIGIVFRSDGYITHNYRNPEAKSKCE